MSSNYTNCADTDKYLGFPSVLPPVGYLETQLSIKGDEPSKGNQTVSLALQNSAGTARVPLAVSLPARYRITELLGFGTFGVVFRATDQELGRDVAVKVDRRPGVGNDSREAFLREARTLADLEHEHIVPIYDIGANSDGSSYIVSKYIPGETLRAVLLNYALTAKQCARLTAQIASALGHIHSRGLVHRDVKPSNILIVTDPNDFRDTNQDAYLIDFGLACRCDMLKTGDKSGTPAYMSPEQVAGRLFDPRSDIFSLGVVLFEMLVGRAPYVGQHIQELLAEITSADEIDPCQHKPGLDRTIGDLCREMLRKNPSDRPLASDHLISQLNWYAGSTDGPIFSHGMAEKASCPHGWSLEISTPPYFFCRVQSVTGERITIGRSNDCVVHIDHPSLSRFHAELVWSEAELCYRLIQPRRTNLTYLNQMEFEGEAAIQHRDQIAVGDLRITVVWNPAPHLPEEDSGTSSGDS